MFCINRLLALFCTMLWFGLAGAAVAEEIPVSPNPDYHVGISDELNFRFLYVPELNTVATVRQDGRVSLPLVGELAVEGLSMAELAARVESLMAAHLRRPQVVVNVQGSTARRVFVGGEVVRPSTQPLSGPLTVLQAVMQAEGLKDTAQPKETIILRRGPGGERLVLTVNLGAVMDGRDLAQDIPLQAYDVIVVPRSGIANVGRWVDQYIKRVIPFNLGFSYSINRAGVYQQ